MRSLLLLLLPVMGFAQTGFRAEFNYLVPDTPVEGGDYRLRGLYSDGDALGFPVDSVTAGKFFYDAKGRLYEIVYSNAAQPLTIEVDTVGHSFAPTLGTGLLTDRTVNILLPFETSKIAGKLRSVVEVEMRKLVDFNSAIEVDKLAELLDVDTAGLGNSYIVRYVADSAKWYVFENNIDGLSDGVRNSRRIILGDASLFNQKGIFIGNNIMQNVTDNREGDNIVIGNNLANGTGAMPANSIIIGEDQIHINQYGASTRTVSIGHGNTSGRVQGSVLIGWEAGKNSWEALQNVYIGEYAGVNATGGSSNIMIGSYAIPLNPIDNNSIVIGGQSSYNSGANIGKGSNTAVFGNPQINGTFLYGNLNIKNYGLGNKEAGDLSKTRSPYIAAFATDGTLLELDTAGLFGGASGASSFVDLNDIDTTGLQDNYAFRYNTTTGLFEAKANNIDGLDDGYTQGGNNLFLGREPFSGYAGTNNVIITKNGADSLRNNDIYSRGMVAIGANVADKMKTGAYESVLIGSNAAENSTQLYSSVFIGGQSGLNANGQDNIYIGTKAGKSLSNQSGTPDGLSSRNTIIGTSASESTSFGSYNTAIGYLANLVNGNYQIVIGSGSVEPYTGNISKGPNSAKIGSTYTDSTFLFGNLNLEGYGLGNKEAADLSKTSTDYVLRPASDGTILEQVNNIDGLTDGYRVGSNLVLGRPNFIPTPSAVDYNSIFIGNNAGNNVLGYANIAIGGEALTNFDADPNTGGNGNTAVGEQALKLLQSGFSNVAMGREAGEKNITGDNNVFVGRSAGYYTGGTDAENTTNFNSGVFLGSAAYGRDSASTNEIVIGANAVGNGSNTATLGDNNITATYLKGTTNLRGYGLGNKEAADIGKTASAYIAGYATDGTLIELPSSGLGISLTDLSVTQNSPGTAGLTYNNTNGVFTYTPPDLSSYLTAEVDGSVTNEIQDLSLTGNTLSLSGDATTVDLSTYLDDQTVTLTGGGITNISGTYPNFTITSTEVDGSVTNEIQDLSITGNILSLSGDATTVDLTESVQDEINNTITAGEGISVVYDDGAGTLTIAAPSGAGNTDEQTLSINSVTAELSISNGNTVDLSEAIDAQVNTLFVDGTNIQSTYDDGANTLTVRTTDALTQIDAITFDNNVTDAVTGRLQYDQDKGTLKFGLANNTPIYLGTDMGWYVKNQSGSSIAKGTPVYVSGTDGSSGRKLISPMIADGSINAKLFLGITAETIANGGDGLVLDHGGIKGVNLSGFSANDVLYVSPTVAGTLVNTEPTAPNLKLPIGYVVNNASNGSLSIRSTVGTYLSENHDVQIASATNGDVLKFDGSKWVDGTDLVDDADADATNEIQTISLVGNDLTLSNSGGTVTLPSYTSESTTASNGLTLSGSDVKLGGTLTETTTINLGGTYSFNISESGSNTLFKVFNDLIEARGVLYQHDGVVRFGDYGLGSIDPSPTQTASDYLLGLTTDGTLIEVDKTAFTQDLSLTGNTLSLSGDATTVDLSGYLDNTDAQAISLTSNTLSITGNASTVDLSGYLDDQTVSLTGAGITAISGTYPNFTITSTEVDGSVTNEGQLSASTVISGTTARLTSNTGGGSNVDYVAGTGLAVSSSGGNTITYTNTLPEATTASNGLTETGTDVRLGGVLTQDVLIGLSTFDFIVGQDDVSMQMYPGDGTVFDGLLRFLDYGSGVREASDISKTASNYKAAFATDGTLIEVDDIDAMVIACSDETTAITTGTAKVTFRAPHAMTITGVRASLTTASSSGTPTVDINESGTSILGTKLTIDATEKTSTTAATAATITDTAIADDAEITIDIDAAGTGATGLKVTILYRKN